MTYLAARALLRATPASWRVIPFKRVATRVQERRGSRDIPLLSLASVGFLGLRADFGDRQQPSQDSLPEYLVVRPGDLVINPMWLTGGSVAVSSVYGAVSPAYRVFRLDEAVDGRFVHHVLRSAPYFDQYRLFTRGDTTFDRTVSQDALDGMPMPVPPLEEQRQIAELLDSQVAALDELFEATARQATLISERLESQRASEICPRAGTSLMPLHTLTDPARPVVYGIVQAGPEYEGGVPYIKTGDVLELDPATLSRTSPEIDAQYSRSRVRPGDIVVAMRASIGACVVVPPVIAHANLTQGTARIAAKSTVDSTWLFHAIRSSYVQSQFDRVAVGSTFRTLNIWDLRRVLVPVPAYETQVRIAHRLSEIEEQTESLNSLLKLRASLVAERRRELITAAVTGELDVTTASGRGVA